MYYIKIKCNILLLIWVLMMSSLYVQSADIPKKKLNIKSCQLRLQTQFFLDSRGVYNRTVKDYYLGKYFSKNDIQYFNTHLKSNNRLGIDYQTQVMAILDSKQQSRTTKYYIRYGYRNHIDFKASKEFLQLVSQGNAPYAGKNLDQINFDLNSIAWHRIGIGKHVQLNAQHSFWLGADYVIGQSFQKFNLNQTELYTHTNGDFIDLKYQLDYRSAVNQNSFSGNGMSINWNYLYMKPKKFEISFSVQDLGFVNWRNFNTNLSWDTSFRFGGIDVSNITQITQPNYTNRLSDSFRNILNSHYNYTNNSTILPSIIKIRWDQYYTNSTSKLKSYIGLDYMLRANYIPQLTFGLEKIKGKHHYAPQIRVGGYGDFNTDFIYTYLNGQKQQLQIVVMGIEGFLIPRYQSGLGLNLIFTYKIK